MEYLDANAVESIANRERNIGLEPTVFESYETIDRTFHAAALQDEMERALETLDFFRETFGQETPEVEHAAKSAAQRYAYAERAVVESERADLQADYIDPAIQGDPGYWYGHNEYDLGITGDGYGQDNQSTMRDAQAIWVDSIAIYHRNADGSLKVDRRGNPYVTVSMQIDGHRWNANCFPLNPGMRNMLPLYTVRNGQVCKQRTLVRYRQLGEYWNIVELFVDRG